MTHPDWTEPPVPVGDFFGWISSTATGTSSKTIWQTLSGIFIPDLRWHDVPHDPTDFGRCYRLLKVMPEWRERLSEVADKYPTWAPFVREWDRLTAMYEEACVRPDGKAPEMFALMKQLEEETT